MSVIVSLNNYLAQSLPSLTLLNGAGEAEMGLKTVWLGLIGIFLIAIAPSVTMGQIIWDNPDSVPFFAFQPTVSIGNLTPNKATTFSLGNNASNIFNITSLQQTLNIQGVWTELTIPIKGSSPLGAIVDFGYLFPSNTRSEEIYNLTSGFASRTWNTSSQLWNLSAAVSYHVFPAVTAVMGFRYESFMTNYKDYDNAVTNNGTLYFNPQALGGTDFTFSGYLPFFGAVVDTSFGNATCLKAGVIGFPTLLGSFVYREVVNSGFSTGESPDADNWNGIRASNGFSSGYFLEAFSQVFTKISWWGEAGAFVKYSGVYGKTTTGVNTTIAVLPATPAPNPNPPPAHLAIPNSFHNQADAIFQRSSWIFGGTISASF